MSSDITSHPQNLFLKNAVHTPRMFKLHSSAQFPPQRSAHTHKLFAPQSTSIKAHQTALLPLGLKTAFPSEYFLFITTTRSPLVSTGGVIDSDYRGELGLIVCNAGDCDVTVERGECVGEGVFFKIVVPVFDVVEVLDDSVRGSDGFGSTGN
ncbi:dUTPase [Trachipleistophora hominis]|uniref:Deoxyuridine 5'-triphosphate nucleotidohydrolase n=1 Tax=Trachipleistophora hominis TaxID=72359 RepID=L7JU05_TRAHO|nr:dUTPase [Trachipleistophora hominis]